MTNLSGLRANLAAPRLSRMAIGAASRIMSDAHGMALTLGVTMYTATLDQRGAAYCRPLAVCDSCGMCGSDCTEYHMGYQVRS